MTSNLGPLLGLISILGKALSQHQKAFLIDDAGDEFHVARRVLSLLAKRGGDEGNSADQLGVSHTQKMPPLRETEFRHQLYEASFAANPADFNCAIETFRASGFPTDQLAFEIIPAIARQLGAAWLSDLITFADVTIGCARLQATLRRLPDGDGLNGELNPSNAPQSQCLVIVPEGAQHTMGAIVLTKQLRRAGQGVTVELEANKYVLSDLRNVQDFECILISATQTENVETLRDIVRVSRNLWTKSKIVIGGSICNQCRDLLKATQADYVTNDWEKVVELCV